MSDELDELDEIEDATDEDRISGSFRITENTGYCAFPVGGDTYRGCAHNCLYCYERQTQNQHLRKGGNVPYPRDFRGLFQSLYDKVDTRYFAIEKKIPVQIGTVSDPFQPIEPKLKVTYNLLKLFAQSGLCALISTKAPHLITDEYIKYILETKSVVKVSFSTFDDAKARVLEPGAIPPSRRIKELKRIKDAGVKTVVRIDPMLPETDYDFDFFSDACNGITIEPFRYSVAWRHSFPIKFWEAVSGEDAPKDGGENKKGTPLRKWVERVEKGFFAPWRSDDIPYHSDGYHWVLIDPYILRKIYGEYRAECEKRGLTFGVCSFGYGVHNIDLNENPYCCCVDKTIGYDKSALVPQWFKDKWQGMHIPIMDDLYLNLALERIIYANAPSYAPIALDKETDESYLVNQDWKERGG